MPEINPYKYFQVLKLDDGACWILYVYNQQQWDSYQDPKIEFSVCSDVFAAKDEVTVLSRAKMMYPSFVIGETEGEIKEWR